MADNVSNDQTSGGQQAVADRAPAKTPPQRQNLPPFKVLLHNDDVNSYEFVVETLVELTPLSLEAAVKVTKETDEQGVGLVVVTHRELAELYHEQLTSKGLTATIEADA